MKVKVLKPFIDIHTKAQYKAGAVIEMDKKRLQEAEKNLKASGGGFLKAIEEAPAAKPATGRKKKEDG